jgi:hypothetical protein
VPSWAFSFLLRLTPELRSRMPKDAFTQSDVREPTLTIVCQPCGRRGPGESYSDAIIALAGAI